jgi:chemotaxis protein histidine kinase CheA
MNPNLEYIAKTFKKEIFQLFEDLNFNNIDEVFRAFHTAKSSFALYEVDIIATFIHKIEDIIVQIKDLNRDINNSEIEFLKNGIEGILKATIFLTDNLSDNFPDDILKFFNDFIESNSDVTESNQVITNTNNQDIKFIKIYLLTISFNSDIMELGNDPFPYLQELNDIGFIEALSTHNIPNIVNLKNPLKLHLKLEILFRSKNQKEKIEEIFNFIEDSVNIEIIELYKLREISNNQDLRLSEKSLHISKDEFKEILNQAEQNKRETILESLFEIGFSPLNSLIENVNENQNILAKKFSKNIEFIFERSSFEIDKNLFETIKESLIHISRNAIDHGFQGLNFGVVKLIFTEYHENNSPHLKIEFSDNGIGIDIYQIIDKAIENGYEIPQKDIFDLLFLPSFTTSESINEISGRGIGLDIVKKKIEGVGGTVKIESQKGIGTTFIINVPLSILLLNGILVYVGKIPLIIPIEEVLSITTKRTKLNYLNLGEILKENCNCQEGIIIKINDEKIELLVDKIEKEIRVPIKFLTPYFKNLDIFNSYSILEDSRVGFILNIENLKRYYNG